MQLVILALICGVALGIHAIRARRGALMPSCQLGPMLAAGTVAALVGTPAVMFATDRPSHPATGNGNLPATGVAGIVVAILALAVFGLRWLRSRSAHNHA